MSNLEASKVTIKAIIGNVLLGIAKIIAGVAGNSTSMIADAIHTLSDIITSIGTLIGIKIASRPADEKFHYGYNKANDLTCFILGLVLLVTCYDISKDSINLMINKDDITTPTVLPIIVSVISILVKEYQFYITMKAAKKTNDNLLKAGAWDHRADSFSSIAVLIGVIGSRMGYKILEPIASMFVVMFVFMIAIEILKTAAMNLLDVSLGKECENEILEIIEKTNLTCKVHSLKTRKHGTESYVEMELSMNKDLTLKDAHDRAHLIEEDILLSLDNIKSVSIHVEPCVCTKKCEERIRRQKEMQQRELQL